MASTWRPAPLLVTALLATACAGAKTGRLPAVPPVAAGGGVTFVVVGDNRGDAEGNQRPVFLETLRAVNEVNPAFVVTTGDMIAGYAETEDQARKQWTGYKKAMAELKPPTFHTPGNHDIWDAMSGRVYRELWGPTFYAFDHGPVRIVGLDTETDRSRIDAKQFAWLEKQLATAGSRKVFLSFHKPLYPVDGHIGNSLDTYPEERDKLHALLVRHKARIGAVFAGHEHLYSLEERDGIRYYITGGAGANLYAPREQGGFHHFLAVRVEQDGSTEIVLHKVGDVYDPPARTVKIKPGEALETWENALAWKAWDDSVGLESVAAPVRSGKRALRMTFDFARCQWPLIYAGFDAPLDLSGIASLAVDVHVPEGLGPVAVALHVPGAKRKEKHEAAPIALTPGWNAVVVPLDGPWLPAEARRGVKGVEWMLSSERKDLRGALVFDRLRALGGPGGGTVKPGDLLEDWEGMMAWQPWSHQTALAPTREKTTQGARALLVRYDLGKWARPAAFAELPARWDLTGVSALAVDIFVPDDARGGLSLALAVAEKDKHAAPPVPLQPGWNTVRAPLDPGWLPAGARAGIVEVEWVLTGTDPTASGWVALDHFRAAK